jgi:Kef-type K+ transport system membrane component KefB
VYQYAPSPGDGGAKGPAVSSTRPRKDEGDGDSIPSTVKRLALFYMLTLCICCAVIAVVLVLGAGLAPPQGPAVLAHAEQTGSALTSLTKGLSDNVGSALSHLLLQLLVIIAAAWGMGVLFRKLGQPAVVGEMVAGILLGPSLLGLVAPRAFAFLFPVDSLGVLGLLAQIGICLFMFTVGMELDLSRVRRTAQTALAVGHAGIVVPYLLGVALAYFLYADFAAPGASFTTFALFMGISMSITAFPVLARILRERGLTHTPLGATAITSAAINDVTAWIILACVVAIAGSNGVSGALLSLLLVVAFGLVMTLGVRPLLPRWLGPQRLRGEPSPATLTIVGLVIVVAALATEVIGIHALFGAFLAGVVMPVEQDFRRKLTLRVGYFSSVLLLPLFFAVTGLRTRIGSLDAAAWLICALVIIVASFGKMGGSTLAARVAGMDWRDSLRLGALMNARGLMELVALNIGYDMGILTRQLFTMLVIMAVATTMLTGPLLTLLGRRTEVTDDPMRVSEMGIDGP